MDHAAFLAALINALLHRSFDAARAVELIGEIAEKKPKQWILRPKARGISKAILHFEDLKEGKGLLTTIELEFQPEWQTSIRALEQRFGANWKWLPATGANRPRAIQFPTLSAEMTGVLMVRLTPDSPKEPDAPAKAGSALLRRFF